MNTKNFAVVIVYSHSTS